MNKVEDILLPLIGEISWGVRQTHGSNFFIEFGNPNIKSLGPMQINAKNSAAQIARRRRRHVVLHGQWTLWVQDCLWALQAWDLLATNDSTPLEMEQPFLALEGQYLKSVRYDCLSKAATLIFDLGAELRLWPNENSDVDEDQWSLSSIDKFYKALLRDGEVIVKSGNEV